ncbi:hypothetical protein C8Q79DRAFT_1005283 [Trametes meyenii]|nr:hypothetical protein C8Q79DRAFT_1005283 [Trametes meyenii]
MSHSAMPSPTSPRKTRSRSRLVSGHYEHGYSDTDVLSPASPAAVSVMKASSMQPVPGRRSGAEKRARHKMTDAQLQRLEHLYKLNTHPSREAKEDLAKEVGMTAKSVLIWFQNRRQDRRRSTKTALKPSPPRTERMQSRKPRKSNAGTPKPSPKYNKSAVMVHATATTATPAPRTATQAAVAERAAPSKPNGTSKKASPVRSTQTTSPHTDNSMDADDDAQSSPSTAPTSVRHLPRVARSPSSSLDSSSSGASGSHTALWRFVRPSPPPPPPPFEAPAPRQALGSLQSNHAARHRPDLEWACANSAARRKHGCFVYRDEDDSDGESSELEDRVVPSTRGTLGVAGDRHRRKRRRLGEGGGQANGRIQVAIPREYEVLFPPDLVLGASLLLTLKHSAT